MVGTGCNVEVEDMEEFQGHHPEESLVVLSEDDIGEDPQGEHIGCQVEIEAS